jgi:hypothetical protein
MKNYELKNQGRRKSQFDFSTKMIDIGYYGMLVFIIGFMLYEWLK